jgi:hypothetical protein
VPQRSARPSGRVHADHMFGRASLQAAGYSNMPAAMASDAQTSIPSPLVHRERVIRTLRERECELRALGVSQLWLFGSLLVPRLERGAMWTS